jgi:hypothetical protein
MSITGGIEDKDTTNEDMIKNLPLSNIIIVKDNMPNVASIELKKHLVEYGYKNGNENSRLRKKVFYFQDDSKIDKFIENKNKSNQSISILLISENIIDKLESSMKYICKLPAININVDNKCYIMNVENYNKFKNSKKNIAEFFQEDSVKVELN